MRIADQNWMQVEGFLAGDDRCVLPLGCTEQHAYLSLATDSILAERIAVEAAEPLGVPVFPVMPFGITPSFMAYPGTISLGVEVYGEVLRQVVEGLKAQGFRRVLIVNGHGGNVPAKAGIEDWGRSNGVKIVWHDWWRGPKTQAKVQEIDPDASHASWMENFEWTRLPGVSSPSTKKPMIPFPEIYGMSPADVKTHVGDGSFGGLYERSAQDMSALWTVGVDEARALLESL